MRGSRAPGGRPNRVFINGRFLTQRLEGVQRSALELVRTLDTMMADGRIDTGRWDVTILVPPRGVTSAPELQRIGVRPVGRAGGHAWEQLELPFHARTGLLVSFCNTAPLAARRQVVTLHDAAVFAAPGGYSRAFRTWYRTMFRVLGRTAESVMTVSEFSREELQRWAGISGDRIRVIRQGVDHLERVHADLTILEKHGLQTTPFVLAVGSRNPNKNLPALIRATALLPEPRPRVVIVGGANPRVFGSEAEDELSDALHLGHVSDGDLRALYGAASVFVFPSRYEGFGFPPLEAMSSGCPVVAADIPVLREVCGDAAMYADANDPAVIAAAVHSVLSDPTLADGLRGRGHRRVRRFRWDECAEQVWDTIRSAAPTPG
jgi:glycosyltransferase involved in cell wall biosynthesis